MTLAILAPYPSPLAPAPADPAALDADRARLLTDLAHRPWADLAWPELLDELRALGRTDIPTARLVEGHADALRILRELGATPVAGARYAVWASRSHATGVRAEATADGWHLTGTLRFASGVGLVERALVPVWLDDAHHQLLDLDVRGWVGDESSWRTGAMAASRSLTVAVDHDAPRDAAVGPVDAYLRRPGFFPGGIGVAAVWAGGAARVVDLTRAATAGAPASEIRTAAWGRIRLELARAGACLTTAAAALTNSEDADRHVIAGSAVRGASGRGQELSTEVRAAVAASVTAVIAECRALAGPAGLAYDALLTEALDDLALYVAQENAFGSSRYLGELG